MAWTFWFKDEMYDACDFRNGTYLCPNCGNAMVSQYSDDDYQCDSCGQRGKLLGGQVVLVDPDPNSTEFEDGSEMPDRMPPCCIACGCGAYPDCMTSCKIFDD